MPKDCGSLQRTRKARTFVSREVFFATYTPRQKTLKLSFAAAAAKLCEAHTFRLLVGAGLCARPSKICKTNGFASFSNKTTAI